MSKRVVKSHRRAGAPPSPLASPPLPASVPLPFPQRWYGKAALLLLGVLLLSLAFAPFKQFYLAWVGLVPYLVVLKHCRSGWRAFGWSWLAGTLFFSANMWWLAWVSGPGTVAVMAILGLYWAGAGIVIRAADLLGAKPDGSVPPHAALRIFGIATVWVGWEWVRGCVPFGGLRWLYLGDTQTPVLHLCQVADLAGDFGVSFWVVLVNAWVAFLVLNRFRLRRLVPSGAAVLAVWAGVLGYGFWRFAQAPAYTTPGPTVLVVQPNIPQDNSGRKGQPIHKTVEFHLDHTRQALEAGPRADLVVWSETIMPPLNPAARAEYDREAREFDGPTARSISTQTDAAIRALSSRYDAALLVGGSYGDDFRGPPDDRYPADARNAAYYYRPAGPSADLRYDKVHLVPFGEYNPFQHTVPWLYQLLLAMGPPNMKDYQLVRGSEPAGVVFPLAGAAGRSWRFVTPICFEDIDGTVVAAMFRGPGGTKRADVLVNITNDGWFKYNEMPQHLQAAQFRSIENRAPTARSVNTGVSGFIDPMGRAYDLIPAGTEGARTAAVSVDSRVTFYTRFGEVIPRAWAGLTGLMALAGVARWWRNRKRA